ncbi:arsenate reductase (thioredoxin) [Lysinibacillus fusiformis]|nr:arsenate reductase (thioredoxin) [Lysinibacillus fusiformis]
MSGPIIYFLCTGNSCRSQMAEGLAKHYLKNKFEILSAGIEAKEINPIVFQVMEEKGIDISNQSSKVVDFKLLNKADIVITLCRDAKERCPILLPRSSHLHWSFEDPTKAHGTDEEILDAFRKVRDEIEIAILKFMEGNIGGYYSLALNQNQFYEPKEDFGELIQFIRQQKGMSVKQLSIQAAITEDYIIKTEKNQTKPSRFFIHRLANAFQMEYDDLINSLYKIN